jgi:hypothetical protein
VRKRLQERLDEVKAEVRCRIWHSMPDMGHRLSYVLTGHYRCYGVPTNTEPLGLFCFRLSRPWRRTLSCRSYKARLQRQRVARLIDRWLPNPQIHHDYPLARFGVITGSQGPATAG